MKSLHWVQSQTTRGSIYSKPKGPLKVGGGRKFCNFSLLYSVQFDEQGFKPSIVDSPNDNFFEGSIIILEGKVIYRLAIFPVPFIILSGQYNIDVGRFPPILPDEWSPVNYFDRGL